MKFPLLNLVAYIFMVTLNALSIVIPLGGNTTQELSDKYNNLFTPIGFTFSIWSIIYTLLLVFSIIPLINYFGKKGQKNKFVEKNIGYLYAISCALNGAWILAWQYQYVGLSVIVMLGLLTTLIILHRNIQSTTGGLTWLDKYITRPAFSIYLGWISVATIANMAAWLVSISWSAWDISPVTWTTTMIVVATLLGMTMLLKHRDIFFNLVILWALYGIMSKRLSVDPIAFESIVTTTQVCMAYIAGAITVKIFRK
ncbi:hypothetical protein KA050_01270 [Candidatus Gracilibacteria bacterium]|nr:hypothetical protein [Candidatus Gracilibacteria bacterium]